jgi:hypothetical protein
MKADDRHTCPTCGNELSGGMKCCPVCMLRKVLAGGIESGDSSSGDILKPTPGQPAQRFHHYEMVAGEDG